MKVNSSDLTASEFSKKMRQKRKNLQNKLNTEMKYLKDSHELKKIQTRQDSEKMLYDLNEKNDQEINQVLLRNQNKLAEHRTNLDKETQRLSKERSLLSNNQQNVITSMNVEFDEKFKEQYSDALRKSEQIFDINQHEIELLEDQAESKIARHRFKTKIKANQNARKNDREIRKEEADFKVYAQNAREQNRRDLELQKIDHLKKINEQNFINQSHRQEKVNVYNHELKVLKEKQIELLKQERASFQQKFDHLKGEHQLIIDRVNNKFSEQAASTILENSKSQKNIEDKAADPFYNLTTLSPNIIKDEKTYKISIKVPEHENDKVRLSVDDRKITLSLTREYQEKVPDELGNYSSTRRSEVLLNKFGVEDILDGKNVTQEYKNGVLSFIVAKK